MLTKIPCYAATSVIKLFLQYGMTALIGEAALSE